jgi:hypothetical protein
VFLALIFILSVFVRLTEAGIVITAVQESYPHSAKTYTSKAFIDKNSMRVETKENGRDNIIIYRNDKKLFWIINPEDNSYTELTRNDMRQIKSQMDEAMLKLQEQMKNMPPEQRDMMEKMMKGAAMPMRPKKTTYRKTDSKVIVNKWKCDKYEGFRDGQKTKEVWTTDWKNIGLEEEHYAVMLGIGDFTSEFTKRDSSFFQAGSDEWERAQGYAGVPVKTITYSMGRPTQRTEIQDVSKEELSSSLFDLPPGLKKQKILGMQ